jgi:hypothetical protein
MNFDQGQFDFDRSGPSDGYRRWIERLNAERRAFESRWGIILGRKVRLQLRDHLRAVEGILTCIDPPRPGKPRKPRFRLGALEFTSSEIESVVALHDPPPPP